MDYIDMILYLKDSELYHTSDDIVKYKNIQFNKGRWCSAGSTESTMYCDYSMLQASRMNFPKGNTPIIILYDFCLTNMTKKSAINNK